jgi:AGZA family xanthine/uracil permease-like MFS transporter
VLGFIGLIHAEQVGWNVGGQIALGYALAGVLLVLFGLAERYRRGVDQTMSEQRSPAPAPAVPDAATA